MLKTVLLSFFILLGMQGIFAQFTSDTTVVIPSGDCGFELEITLQNPYCENINDGFIEILVPNADVLSFSWLNIAADGNVASNLSAGVYEVLVSSEDCTDTLNFELEYQYVIDAPDLVESFCGEGGFVNLLSGLETDGTALSYMVETIYGTDVDCDNCQEIDGVFIGETSYLLVHLTDAEGCTATREVFVTVLDALELEAVEQEADICNGNGTFSIFATGGSGNYYYSLDGGENLQTSPVFSGLEGDVTYTVLVEDQQVGCAESIEVVLPQSFTLPEFDFTVDNPICFGEDSGAIIGTPISTTDTYQYALSLMPAVDALQNSPVFTNLSPGTYTVYAITENDLECITALNEFVIESPEPLNLESSVTNPDCPGEDGEVELSTDGNNAGFQFSLDGENYFDQNIWGGLPEGIYTAFVQNNEGCIDSISFAVEAPEVPDVETETTPSCPDAPSGIVIVESGELFTGGGYFFSLDSLVWQEENIFNNLPPGADTMYIQNPEGCVFLVPFYIPQAIRPDLEWDISDVSCPGGNDGSVVVEVVGGGPPEDYSYSMDEADFQANGFFDSLTSGVYSLYVMDSIACVHDYLFEIQEPDFFEMNVQTVSVTCYGDNDGALSFHSEGATPPYEFALNGAGFQEDSLFTNLSAGLYIAIVTDDQNCAYSDSVYVESPEEIELNITVVDESCDNHNGAIVSSPTGGTAPYSYQWNTGDSTSSIIGLVKGLYFVTLTDTSGCTTEGAINVENQDGPNLWANLTDVRCYGTETGAIDLNVASGSPPFVYTWSNGAYTQDLAGLQAGSYIVTVTDVYYCTSSKSFTVHEQTPIQLNYQSGQAGDYWFINLIVEGGVQPYNYEWSNGETTEDIFNLMPGDYSVTLTDDLGCSDTLEISVGITASEEPDWAEGLNLFPNPVEGYLNIELTLKTKGSILLSIVNLHGQLISKKKIPQWEENHLCLQTNSLPPGVYIVVIELEGELVYRRFIKN